MDPAVQYNVFLGVGQGGPGPGQYREETDPVLPSLGPGGHSTGTAPEVTGNREIRLAHWTR